MIYLPRDRHRDDYGFSVLWLFEIEVFHLHKGVKLCAAHEQWFESILQIPVISVHLSVESHLARHASARYLLNQFFRQ